MSLLSNCSEILPHFACSRKSHRARWHLSYTFCYQGNKWHPTKQIDILRHIKYSDIQLHVIHTILHDRCIFTPAVKYPCLHLQNQTNFKQLCFLLASSFLLSHNVLFTCFLAPLIFLAAYLRSTHKSIINLNNILLKVFLLLLLFK